MARARPRGIKQPHPLGSVATRAGVAQLLVASSSSITTSTGVKISALPAASAGTTTDQFEVNQGGVSKRLTLEQIRDLALDDLTDLEVDSITITPEPDTLDMGLRITQTMSGTETSFASNLIEILSDDTDIGNGFGSALNINHIFGGTASKGGRSALSAYLNLANPTNAASTNHNYCGVVGVATAVASDGGTDPASASTSNGALFGAGLAGVCENGGTALLNVTAAEFNTAIKVGGSAWAKSLAQFSGRSDDANPGAGINSMLWLYNQGGSTAPWTEGIRFDDGGGYGLFPFNGTSTVLYVGAGTVNHGVDLSLTTINSTAFRSPGFSVSGTGALTGTTATFSGNVTAPGAQIQMVSGQSGTSATGTTVIPFDDTIPQQTEGDQYMALSITPKSATSKLIVEVNAYAAHSVQPSAITAALFQDSVASAVAASCILFAGAATVPVPNTIRYVMTSGTTSAITFKVRIGGSSAGTLTFNGSGGGRLMGGVMNSGIVIREVAV